MTPTPEREDVAAALAEARAEIARLDRELEILWGPVNAIIHADNMRKTYHRMPNERLRPGDGEGRKSRAKKMWLRSLNRATAKARAALRDAQEGR